MCFWQNLAWWSPNGIVFPKQELMMQRVGPTWHLSQPSAGMLESKMHWRNDLMNGSLLKTAREKFPSDLSAKESFALPENRCVYHQDTENVRLTTLSFFLWLPGSCTLIPGPRATCGAP